MLHFIWGIRDFSRLHNNLIPNPSIDSIRELDKRFCSYLERISKSMPDEVFSFNTDNNNFILTYAVRALNLFHKCFKMVLDKSSPENYHYGNHCIFYQFCWDYCSCDISPSWLIYDLLIPHGLMTNEEKTFFIGNGKSSTEIRIDSLKAEAGALLMQLICKRDEIACFNERMQDKVNSLIFSLIDIAGTDYVNPVGVSPLLAAVLSSNSDVDFYKMVVERGIDVNKKDSFGRSPFVISLSPYKMPVFKLFLENGADTNVLNTDNNAVCELAADKN